MPYGINPEKTAAEQAATEQAEREARNMCPFCATQMRDAGELELRHGGNSGGWKLLFGDLAELGEGMLRVSTRACPACGFLALFRRGTRREG